ncbi:MAG: hypothetical protein PVG96_07890 [Desulfobacterales bacterium]|jgi:hypothetical protein
MGKILSRLQGGDRRSIGNVGEVVAAVRKKPDLFKDLVAGLFEKDPVVRMRAADAMEKISLEKPESLQPFKTELIRLAQQTQQQELRWHMAQMIPRLKLKPKDETTVTDIFFDYLNDNSKIVVTFAMQALTDLALKKGAASARVIRAIEELTRTGSPAIQSRGKKLLPKLKKLSQKE